MSDKFVDTWINAIQNSGMKNHIENFEDKEKAVKNAVDDNLIVLVDDGNDNQVAQWTQYWLNIILQNKDEDEQNKAIHESDIQIPTHEDVKNIILGSNLEFEYDNEGQCYIFAIW